VGTVASADHQLGQAGLMRCRRAWVPAPRSGVAGFYFPPEEILHVGLVWHPVDLAQPDHTAARGQPSMEPARPLSGSALGLPCGSPLGEIDGMPHPAHPTQPQQSSDRPSRRSARPARACFAQVLLNAVVFVGGSRPGWVTVSRERTWQRSGLLLAS
jgi:hypothetical protein